MSTEGTRINEIREWADSKHLATGNVAFWLADVRFLLAALDAAEQQAAEWKAEAERRVHPDIATGESTPFDYALLEARAVQAEQERDEALRAEESLRLMLASAGTARDRAEARVGDLDARVLAAEARATKATNALREMFDLAAVSTEGDPWFAEQANLDVEAIYARARAVLADLATETPNERVAREDHDATVRLYGAVRVAELEQEANK